MALSFYLLTIAGMFGHAIKKWFNNEIEGSHIFRWYLDNPKYTVGILFAAFGATVSWVATGLYTDINDPAQVAACFAVAFSIDSFNKQ